MPLGGLIKGVRATVCPLVPRGEKANAYIVQPEILICLCVTTCIQHCVVTTLHTSQEDNNRSTGAIRNVCIATFCNVVDMKLLIN